MIVQVESVEDKRSLPMLVFLPTDPDEAFHLGVHLTRSNVPWTNEVPSGGQLTVRVSLNDLVK